MGRGYGLARKRQKKFRGWRRRGGAQERRAVGRLLLSASRRRLSLALLFHEQYGAGVRRPSPPRFPNHHTLLLPYLYLHPALHLLMIREAGGLRLGMAHRLLDLHVSLAPLARLVKRDQRIRNVDVDERIDELRQRWQRQLRQVHLRS